MVLGMEKGNYILTALLEKSKLMLIWSCCIITNPLFPIGVTLQGRKMGSTTGRMGYGECRCSGVCKIKPTGLWFSDERPQWQFLGWIQARLDGITEPEVAEVIASRHAVHFILALAYKHVVVASEF
jgi:hypothetical protein